MPFALSSSARQASALLALAACLVAAPAHAEDDVSFSWDKGEAHVPGSFFATSPAKVQTDRPLPVVLYMHGCSGLTSFDDQWARSIKGLGFVVIQPNSFKRDRPVSCDPVARRAGLFRGVYAFRAQELAYAREQIAKANWADNERVILMGHSEGGVLTARTSRDDFRGAVISGWHCRTTGIDLPARMPVLALDHVHDPWFPTEPPGGCQEFMEERPLSRVYTQRGSGHATHSADAVRELTVWLRDIGALPAP